MFRKISTILLSLVLVWYAAGQVRGEKTTEEKPDGIHVQRHTRAEETDGEMIYGQIRANAAVRALSAGKEVSVQFVLKGANGEQTKTVTITPDSLDENGLLSASAVFMDLYSGEYSLHVEKLRNAEIDYILAEDGDDARYRIDDKAISFTLSHDARQGSAWFMLAETEGWLW